MSDEHSDEEVLDAEHHNAPKDENDDPLLDGDAGDTDAYRRGEKRPIDHGAKVRAKVKRGEDTRDQDTLLIEGRGETAAEAAASFEGALQRAEERDWAGRLRELQADTEEDDE